VETKRKSENHKWRRTEWRDFYARDGEIPPIEGLEGQHGANDPLMARAQDNRGDPAARIGGWCRPQEGPGNAISHTN